MLNQTANNGKIPDLAQLLQNVQPAKYHLKRYLACCL